MVRGRGHCGGSFLSLCVHESYNPMCLNTIAVLAVLFLCVCCPPVSLSLVYISCFHDTFASAFTYYLTILIRLSLAYVSVYFVFSYDPLTTPPVKGNRRSINSLAVFC